MTDKELQRLKIMEVYFEKNNYIDNSEVQKILNVSDSTARRFLNKLEKNNYIDNSEAQKILNVSDSMARRFLNKLVKGGILEAIGERKGRKYRKK